MNSSFCQRWREQRASYRPAGEPLDPSRYGVEVLEGDAEARSFVCRHHYSRSYPAARVRVGLFRQRNWFTPELVGVAVFSVPAQAAALPRWAGVGLEAGVELGRFVLLDDVPANGETWFLSRALKALHREKPELRAVLSYSDPLPRTTLSGEVITPGHIGTIYRASNAVYGGRSGARSLFLDREGRVVSSRALSKIRLEEKGSGYAYRQLLQAGAPARQPGEDARAYVDRALNSGAFRKVRHPGNFTYLFALGDKRTQAHTKKAFAPALPYPCPCAACREQE